MRKVKHEFRHWEYSEADMQAGGPYSKKYAMSFTLETENTRVGDVLSYSEKDSVFSVLRALVKRKHETIERYEALNMCIKQTKLPHIPIGKLK